MSQNSAKIIDFSQIRAQRLLERRRAELKALRLRQFEQSQASAPATARNLASGPRLA